MTRRKVNLYNLTLPPNWIKIGENNFGNIFATRRKNRTTAPYAFLSWILKDEDGYHTDEAILVTGIQSEEEAFSIIA